MWLGKAKVQWGWRVCLSTFVDGPGFRDGDLVNLLCVFRVVLYPSRGRSSFEWSGLWHIHLSYLAVVFIRLVVYCRLLNVSSKCTSPLYLSIAVECSIPSCFFVRAMAGIFFPNRVHRLRIRQKFSLDQHHRHSRVDNSFIFSNHGTRQAREETQARLRPARPAQQKGSTRTAKPTTSQHQRRRRSQRTGTRHWYLRLHLDLSD